MRHDAVGLTRRGGEALRARLVERAAELGGEIREGVRPEALREEPREAAGDEVRADMAVASAQRDARELAAIQEALARVERGTYGLCIDCGVAVPWRRLAASPEAARCMRCESERERLAASPHARL